MKIKIAIFFLILCLASSKGAIVEFSPSMQRWDSLYLLAIDVLISFLGLSSIFSVPKSVVYGFCIFLIVSTINFLNGSGNEVMIHINGLREITNIYFLFIFFYHLFNSGYQYYFNFLFQKFSFVFLFLQIPFSIKQFLKFGAGDDVGGTLGNGYSGVLTLSIFLLVYYLIENKNHNQSNFIKLKHLLSISYFFIPVFLNETKITFILIPLLIITLVKFRQVSSFLFPAVVGAVFLMVFAKLYSDYGRSYDHPIKAIYNKEYLSAYLSAPEYGDEVDIPRFTKIIIARDLLSKENLKLFFGQEYGAFKGGTTIGLTPFATKYVWLLYGSKPYIFYVLITGGITLLVLLIVLFISLIRDRPYPGFKNFSNGFLVFLSCIFLIVLFYNDALRYEFFASIFIYVFFYAKYFIYPKYIGI